MATGHILIADDDPDVADFVRTVALSCGFDAEAVCSAENLQSRLAIPQLTHILLDLNMPGLDGIEVLRHLARIQCSAQIVILSGVDHKIREAARRLGSEMGLNMVGALGKPIHLADLRKLLNDLKPAYVEPTPASVRQAIESEELILEYQPRVELATGALAGVEVLVRWRQPSGNVVMPGDFLPVIEGTDVIDALTWAVIEQALDQVRRWANDGVICPVSINLSPRNLTNLAFVDRLVALCGHHGVDPDFVTLELTETAAVRDQLVTIDILTRLRLKGFNLAIDDFGTGFSSIAQLHRMPFNEVKIDRSFVAELGSCNDAEIIVRAMIDLAHNLNLRACAEGVEDESALDALRRLGCDLVQGYHLGRPMAGAVIPNWAARRREPVLRPVRAGDQPGQEHRAELGN